MWSSLERTLGPEQRFVREEIAVANALHLERWRYWLESALPESILAALGASSDFVANGVDGKPDWQAWWEDQLAPAQRNLEEISTNLGIRMIPKATFQAVQRISESGIRLLFLIAHHPAESDEIEFHDRRAPWDEVCGVLTRVVPVMMICSSGAWLHDVRERRLLPAGGYLHEMPVREGIEYLTYLLPELMAGTPLELSRHVASLRFHAREDGASQ
jgi:hypothetical protein